MAKALTTTGLIDQVFYSSNCGRENKEEGDVELSVVENVYSGRNKNGRVMRDVRKTGHDNIHIVKIPEKSGVFSWTEVNYGITSR